MQVIPLKKRNSRKREAGFRWKIILVTILVNVLAYALVMWTLAQSRQHYQERAETSAQNIARRLKQNVADTLETIEMNLLDTKAEIERQQRSDGINDAVLNAFLKRLHTRLPERSSIRVANANSVALHNGGKVPASEALADDREYFNFLQNHPFTGIYISKPLLDRSSGDWILTLSQRFDHSDGSFAGVLIGTVSLNHLQKMFALPEIGAHGRLSLTNEATEIIARHPKRPDAEAGAILNIISPEWSASLRSDRQSWMFIDSSSVDGVKRTTAVHKVANFPLYVTVGLAHDDYLEDWWRTAGTAGESLLLFTLLTALLSLLFYHTRLNRMLVVAYKCSKRSRPGHRTVFCNRTNHSASSRFHRAL